MEYHVSLTLNLEADTIEEAERCADAFVRAAHDAIDQLTAIEWISIVEIQRDPEAALYRIYYSNGWRGVARNWGDTLAVLGEALRWGRSTLSYAMPVRVERTVQP